MHFFRPLVFSALIMSANSSVGMDRLGMTDSEIASMPPVCIARMSGGDQYNQWRTALGPDFDHTHHYCMGINYLNRAYKSRDRRDRGFNLKNAQDNLMYMVKAASPTFSLMPDVYLNLGFVHRMSGRTGEAAASFTKAIALNPQTPRAYRELADFYAASGNRTKALEVVTDGLKHNPGTKSLQRYFRELGGKLPYPEAVVKQPLAGDAKGEIEPAVTPEPAQPAKEPASAATEANRLPPDADRAPQAEPPKVGSPKNPYCRFCPD